MPHLRANDPRATGEISKAMDQLAELGWYHSIELPDGRVLKGLHTIEQLKQRLARFPVPENLSGKRVLDIGAWDGWFSFEMERRGAEVVALDVARIDRFLVARDLLGSKVEYRIGDICRLSPKELGYFDIVLFLGVLYHTKHPLLALEKVCELTKDVAFVESMVTDDGPDANGQFKDPPAMQFYERDELLGRFDNWVGLNTPCLLAFCRTAGFARVEPGPVVAQRAHVTCYRRWPQEPIRPAQPAPTLIAANNSSTRDNVCDTRNDEYVSIWFKTAEPGLTRESVFPEIGPYGTIPVYLGATGVEGWEVVAKLPPGLPPGWQDVRLRTAHSDWSKPMRIAVDLSPEAEQGGTAALDAAELRIEAVRDGKTWEHDQVLLDSESYVSLWVAGVPEQAVRRHVGVRLNDHSLTVTFLSAPLEDGLRQINALLPAEVGPGDYGLVAVCGRTASPPVSIKVRPRKPWD
jgi:tRNA (mo5U34)-methyltransferase